MDDMEVITEYTAEQRAQELRELAKRAELYRLNKHSSGSPEDFSFRTVYFEEAEQIIS